MKSPLKYYLDLVSQIGLCFSSARDEVYEAMGLIDKGFAKLPDLRKIYQIPILKYSPSTSDMPDPDILQDEVELGMWVAWADIRDYATWVKRIGYVAKGYEYGDRQAGFYMDDLRKLQPVVERMSALRVLDRTTMNVSKSMVFGKRSMNA